MRGLLQDYSTRLDRKSPNLAPLIDVVFQLILFFLVTSSFTWYSGMTVKLPEASSVMPERPPETVTLEITRAGKTAQYERMIVKWWEKSEDVSGELFWPPKKGENMAAGLESLRFELQSYKSSLGEGRTPTIVIAAENSVPYQSVITVIDMCEQLGLSDIVLAIQRQALNSVDSP